MVGIVDDNGMYEKAVMTLCNWKLSWVNSYGKVFFRDFKYLSDSRCHWREPIEDIVQSEQYDRLHILTHAFWYHEQNQTLSETIEAYLRKGNVDRYEHMLNNITDLPRIINKGLL